MIARKHRRAYPGENPFHKRAMERWNLIIYERRREFALQLLQGESTACLSRLVIRADGEFL